MAFVTVSGKPPLLLIITAHPLLEASRLVLPKGSCHLEHAIVMLDSLKLFKTLLWFWKPKTCKFLCLKNNFSLGSSPKTKDFQSGYFFKILIIALPNKSYPLALFNLPTKVIIFLRLYNFN